MSNKDKTETTGTTTIMHVTPPSGGSAIVHGVTAQVDIAGAVNIAKVDWRQAIQKRLETVTKQLKKGGGLEDKPVPPPK